MAVTGAPSPDDDALLRALAELYRDADARFAGWSCPASTACCRFGVTGREPYVTSIELLALRRALARRGGPLSPRRRALALAPSARDERTCSLLDRDGRCAVYADRPLGCRTFHCGDATPGAPVGRAELAELVRRVQALAERHETDGARARPLSRALP